MKQAIDELEAGLDAGDVAEVHRATDRIRQAVREALDGRAVAQGSVLVERRRRLEHALAEVDDAAAGDRREHAREQFETIADLAPRVVEQARELDEIGEEPPASVSGARNVLTVARKELVVGLQGTKGLLLVGLLLATFGIGVPSALGSSTSTGAEASVALVWNYAHSLDFLALPLAGILAGYGLVNEELRSDTIHVLGAQPVSRVGIVLGKWLGMAATLTFAVAASAGLVGAGAYATTGTLGRPASVFVYPLACLLLAIAFGSIALLASTVLDRTGPTLATGLGAFILLGPLWQNVFLTRSLEQGGLPETSAVLTYLATPFTAWWNWTSELLGPINEATGLPEGEPWHAALVAAVERGQLDQLPFYATQGFYALVVAVWIAVCLVVAALVFRRRDLG